MPYHHQAEEQGIEVKYEEGTIWLTQKLMAQLFDVTLSTINHHLKNIYETKELSQKATIRNFLIVQKEGAREVSRNIDYYNLDTIISVGYRVNSVRATQFRQWATQVFREFAIKGYVLDKKRMENGEFLGKDYFERLLDEIREIRLSERRFYQKITDIYITSIDYNKDAPTTKAFFTKVQNKLHYAIHGNTVEHVDLYNINNFGAQYIHFRCGPMHLFLQLQQARYLTCCEVQFRTVRYTLSGLDSHQLVIMRFAWRTASRLHHLPQKEWLMKPLHRTVLEDFPHTALQRCIHLIWFPLSWKAFPLLAFVYLTLAIRSLSIDKLSLPASTPLLLPSPCRWLSHPQSVGSEEAHFRASLRLPLQTVRAVFPHTAFCGCAFAVRNEGIMRVYLRLTVKFQIFPQFPWLVTFGFFTKGTFHLH